MVNLKTFDLNLLVMFEALISEAHVTRAARRLRVTQPAMTNALRRLRLAFEDELLLRTPIGMVPTAKALAYIGPVRAILQQMQELFEREQRFDPSSSPRTFRIRMSDLLAGIVLPSLMHRVRKEAARCRLEILSLPPAAIVPKLESNEIDLALSMGVEHGQSVLEQTILTDRFVCMLGAHHPMPTEALDRERFAQLPQFRIAQGPFDTIFVDGIVAALGADHQIALSAISWLAAGPLLETTDLVVVTSQRFAALTARHFAITVKELPINTPPIEWRAYWHRRNDADEGLMWLRRLVSDVARAAG